MVFNMTGYKDTYIYIPKKGIIRGSIAFEKGKVIGYDEDSSFEKLDENDQAEILNLIKFKEQLKRQRD